MFAVMIKVDDTLPWIELKKSYQTRREAKQAAEDFIKSLQMKVVAMPEKAQPLKQAISIRTKR